MAVAQNGVDQARVDRLSSAAIRPALLGRLQRRKHLGIADAVDSPRPDPWIRRLHAGASPSQHRREFDGSVNGGYGLVCPDDFRGFRFGWVGGIGGSSTRARRDCCCRCGFTPFPSFPFLSFPFPSRVQGWSRAGVVLG